MKLTDYLAIYGALLSSVVFLWTAARARPKIKVRLILAIEGEDDKLEHGVGISIQNPSSHTAHISNVSLLYPLRKPTVRERLKYLVKNKSLPLNIGWCHGSLSVYGLDDKCPASIEPGKSHWIFVPDVKLREVLSGALAPRLKAVAQDALWRNKYSPSFTYDVPALPEA